jgi:CubicO group peptidase (beta-lactamase class C family)
MSPIYTGPALSTFQYIANLSLMSVAASHFISRMPLARAMDATYQLKADFPAWWEDEGSKISPIVPDGKDGLVHTAGGYRRVARFYGDLGCVLVPSGHDEPFFDAQSFRNLPRSGRKAKIAVEFRGGDSPDPAIAKALDLAFDPEARTASLVVLKDGRAIYERYDNDADETTKLATWSMGKSVVSMLVGLLATRGKLDLDEEAPLPAWREHPDDPRRKIRLRDLVQMSSGLRFSGYEEPSWAWGQGTSDHFLPYTEAIDFYRLSWMKPAEHPRGTVGRYRNCDPACAAATARAAVESDGTPFVPWVYETLADLAGEDQFCFCPDAHGNPIFTGLTYGTARGWARLGQLMLDGGVIGATRVLSANYVRFAQSVAPAWEKGGSSGPRAAYGGGFWINRPRTGELPEFALPADAFFAAGGGCNYAIVVPSLGLVVVRQGDFLGLRAKEHLNAAFAQLLPQLGTKVRDAQVGETAETV